MNPELFDKVLAKFEALSHDQQQQVVGAAMVVAPEAFERAIETITHRPLGVRK